jgi:hypothetical protein
MKRIIFTSLVALLGFSLAFSMTFGPRYRNMDRMSMGNAGIALADDGSSVFYNPAGLNNYFEYLTLYGEPLRLTFGPSFYDMLNFLAKNISKLSDPTEIDNDYYDDFAPIDGTWSTFGYTPEFRANTNNMGIGITTNLQPNIMLESGLYAPKIGIGVQNDLILAGGIAKRFKRRFSAGINMKYFYRTVKPDTVLGVDSAIYFAVEAAGALGSLDAIKEFARTHHGMGFDFGMIYHAGLTKYGVVLQDFPTFLSGRLVHPALNVGVGRHLGVLQLNNQIGSYIKDITMALDIHDFFGPGIFRKKIHMGLNLDSKIMELALGLNQGYPTFGITLKYWLLRFQYVYFKEEHGRYIGQIPFSMHVISISMDISI